MKRVVNVGGVLIGGENPVSIQSMTNTDTRDVLSTVSQINKLADAGCEIVRVAVPDMEAAAAVSEIKKQIHIPLVCDIHFDYRLAIESAKNRLRFLWLWIFTLIINLPWSALKMVLIR